MYYKKLNPDAIEPTRAYPTDAGLDLYALEDFVIPASTKVGWFSKNVQIGTVHAKTGIAVAIHEGYVGFVCARSGTSFNFDIEEGAGVIDASYRGELNVKLYNNSSKPYQVKRGDKIAQLVIVPIVTPNVLELVELPEGSRGNRGLGSTGR